MDESNLVAGWTLVLTPRDYTRFELNARFTFYVRPSSKEVAVSCLT